MAQSKEDVKDFDHPVPPGMDEDAGRDALEDLLSGEFPENEGDDEQAADEEDDADSDETEEDDTDEDDTSDEGDDDTDEEEEESEEDEEDEEAEEDTPMLTVKIDGEEQEVTLEEAAKGYQRTADYTRKTQALAEERKAFQQEQQATREARDEYSGKLDQLGALLTQLQPAEPDWDKLKRTDKAAYAAEWAAHQQRQSQMKRLSDEQEKVRQQQEADAKVQYQEVLVSEQKKLLSEFPDWTDDKVAQKERDELFDYGLSIGFLEKDLEAVVDHRAIVILNKAMLYDRMQTDGKKAIEGKKKKSKSLRPGGKKVRSSKKPSSKKAAKARARVARSGRVDDAQAALESMIPDDF
jgi:hypothetical protein